MNEFTQLVRPLQSQITIDSVAKDCPSEGFNYPTFRQLAKNARLLLSSPLSPQVANSYHRLFAIANSKGWFVAVKSPSSGSGSELIFSPLDELRAASEAAKPDDETLFNPKRTVTIPTRANIVAFACGETKLLVGLDDGSVVVYDTSSLFTPGTNDIQPLARNQIQSSPLRQILPNPGTEPNLSDLVAVVGDGKVELLNMQLESQGGWVASDLMTQPIAVDWSPKGKHIAVGLQTGDILTFSTTNKSTPHKHIPPTVDSILVSLNWLGPGHTFRTSYAAQNNSPTQHIVVLDIKSSTATYYAPDHPFLSSDRDNQAAYILNFPKWDVDSAASDESKYLTVVGDLASVDLEILGNVGNQWHRQSQDNPLTLPLDKELNDTFLLGLEADLTDPRYDSPIMYAYLNDGSLQGWYVEHTKPYLGMMNGKALGTGDANSQMSTEAQEKSKDSDMGSSTFGSGPVSTFGQSNFGQQPAQSAFGASSTPAFGQTGFGQQSTSTSSAFGSTTSAFGKSSFGQPSTFGVASGSFGQPSNQPSTTPSAFGGAAPATGFAAFSGGSAAFGGGGAFGSGAFSSSPSTGAFGGLNSSNSTSVFGQGSFGAPATPSKSASPSDSPTMTREASMSDSTPSFGGLALGSSHPTDPNATNSMFGSFSTAPTSTTQPTSSTFGGGSLVKPASGFGAFGNLQTSSAFSAPKSATTVSAFAPVQSTQAPAPSTASPAFGQSGFGQPSFGKPGFSSASGTSAFGAFGNAAQTQKPATTSGGFSAFASTPTTFGSALGSTEKPAESKPTATGGFSAFGSGTPAAFGSTAQDNASKPSPSSGGGFGAFASTTPSPFGQTSSDNASKPSSSSGGGFSAFASATPSPFGQTSSDSAPQASSASGFSAFASTTSAFSTTTETLKSSATSSSSSVSSTPAAEPKPRTTVFGTPNAPPAGGSSSLFRSSTIRSSLAKGDDSPVGSPPSSPEAQPAPAPSFTKQDGKASSPFGGNDSKSPSPFGQSASPTPAASSGAFGNIQVTPSAFRPASGFGAFGSNETPKSSAFFKKPDETPPPVSAFGQISTAPKTPVSGTASPAFGSTSALGGPKSVFPPARSIETTPTKAPAVGGFGAFSGAPSGFSAFAGPKTSFTDLLKSKGDEAADPIKPAASPVFSKPEAESSKASVSVFAALAATPNQDKPAFGSAFTPISKETDKGEASTSGSKEDDKKISKSIPSEPSYGNLSLSASSSGSFVEVDANQDGSGELEEGEVSDEDGEHSDFLSDNYDESSYKDGDSANEESDQDDLPEDRNTPSPELPLPVSRSPSATPQPEVPTIEVSGDADDEASPSPNASPAREASTTPPSTPVKESKPLFGSSPTLATPGGASSTSPFSLGMGRPSTRPVRSSPLANAVSAEDEEDEKKKSPPKAKPAVSPKPVYGVLQVETKEVSKEAEESSADKSPTTKRPKTPPLLSTMGPPQTPSPFLAPAIAKASSSGSDSASSKSSSPATFSLGAKPAAESAPSLFGIPKATAEDTPISSWTSTTPSKPELARATTAPAAPGTPTPSLFGGSGFFPPPPLISKSPIPAFNMPPFSLSGATAASPIPAGGPSLFGSKSAPASPPPTGQGLFGAKATSPPQPTNFFGMKPAAAGPSASSPSLFGNIQTPKSPSFAMQVPANVPPKPSPEAILEEGMQKECAALVTMVVDDLAELSMHGKKLAEALKQAGTSAGGSRNIRDLGVQEKWSLGDLAQFKKLLLQYEGVLDGMEATHEKHTHVVRDLQSSMLKCGTRKEEIARFHKARDDKDFAKMLKSRTLGPEHSETQTHLRKNIRAIRDRVQKLESRLQENKKKLAQAASYKPTVKAPSLDTINRTYRNIEIAIDQQADEVSRLAARISKLNVEEKGGFVARRDARLPDVGQRRQYDVTPNVAATTAAALNAERSAHRLKIALLSVRKEPLLNDTAATAPPAPSVFKTPQKATSGGLSGFAFQTPIGGSLFAEASTISASEMPDWNLPEDNFNPTEAANLPSRTRGGETRRKHPSVPLKRTPGTGAVPVTPPPADFDWGPLPSFVTPPPANSLPNSFFSFSTPKK